MRSRLQLESSFQHIQVVVNEGDRQTIFSHADQPSTENARMIVERNCHLHQTLAGADLSNGETVASSTWKNAMLDQKFLKVANYAAVKIAACLAVDGIRSNGQSISHHESSAV